MMSDLSRYEGIETAFAVQAAKNNRDALIEWNGTLLLKDRIMQAIDNKSGSIVGYCKEYEEPNLQEVEDEILLEQGWGSEEFEMNFREPPDSLGCFEITLRYPGRQNPRGAGRKRTGHRVHLSLGGLSQKAFDRLNKEASIGNRSAYIVSLIEDDNS